jgi:hypothetical protein
MQLELAKFRSQSEASGRKNKEVLAEKIKYYLEDLFVQILMANEFATTRH